MADSVVVVAAGNEGPEPMTVGVPGNVPYAIAVGAFSDAQTPGDPSDEAASFDAVFMSFTIRDRSSTGPESAAEAQAWLESRARAFGHFINGATAAGSSSETGPIFNPAIGEQIAEVAFANARDVDQAVQAAKAAQPAWAETPLADRAALAMSFLLPVLFFLIFAAIFSGATGEPLLIPLRPDTTASAFGDFFVDWWDAFLWLVAFVFIELNVVEWRHESHEEVA